MLRGECPAIHRTDTLPEGGRRFIFRYRVLNGCYVCPILG